MPKTSWSLETKCIKDRAWIFALAAILYLLIPLAALAVLLPSLLLRKLVSLLASLFRPDLIELFKDGGLIFASLESLQSSNKSDCLLHLICDGTVCVDRLRVMVKEKLLDLQDEHGNFVYRRMWRYWTPFMGFLFWKDDPTFMLENHVRLYDYSEPEFKLPVPCTEEDISRVTGGLLARPWPANRSPWELLVIPYVKEDDGKKKEQSLVTMRFHHGLGDGITMQKLIIKISGSEGVKLSRARLPELRLWQRIALNAVTVLSFPYNLADYLVTSQDGPNGWHTPVVVSKRESCKSRKLVTLFSGPIPTDTIQAIRRRHPGTGYNTVLYAIVVGTLRRMMLRSRMKYSDQLSAVIPVPLPGHPGGFSNHYSLVALKFSPGLQTASERIREVSAAFEAIRRSPTAHTTYAWYSEYLLPLLPPAGIKLAYRWDMTILISSLPAPEEVVATPWGVNITGSICAVGCFPRTGAFAALLSMAAQQRISLTLDDRIFAANPRIPKNFAELVNQEINELLLGCPSKR